MAKARKLASGWKGGATRDAGGEVKGYRAHLRKAESKRIKQNRKEIYAAKGMTLAQGAAARKTQLAKNRAAAKKAANKRKR